MHTFIIAALSADGFLADQKDQKSTSWTSKEDFQFFVKRTKQARVCVMGSRTYKTIGHPLKDRLTIVYTTHPEDIEGSQPLPSTIHHQSFTIPYTTSLPPNQLVTQLSNGYSELAICGGSHINSLFLQANLVNTLYLTYEPILFGQGIPLLSQPATQNLKLKKTTPLSDQTILLEYQVVTPPSNNFSPKRK
jgi:dihydrofolate reductase